jgi:acyl carrier protein
VEIVVSPVSSEDVKNRLTPILREVFDDDTLLATPELTADEVDEWDSLNHVRLILTVEREFAVKFAASEITGLKNVGDLIGLIEAKLS